MQHDRSLAGNAQDAAGEDSCVAVVQAESPAVRVDIAEGIR